MAQQQARFLDDNCPRTDDAVWRIMASAPHGARVVRLRTRISQWYRGVRVATEAVVVTWDG